MNNDHIDASLNKIRTLFQQASDRIDSLKPGEKIPATQLAEEVAKNNGMTGPQFYPCLLFLIRGYPGVEVKRGAHGGIVKLPITTEVKQITEAVAESITAVDDTK